MPTRVAAPVTLKVVPSSWTILAVPLVPQEQTEWCWAACAQMVLRYYGNKTVRQCDVVARLFGRPCCDNPGSEPCNEPALVEDVAKIYSQWGRLGKIEYHNQSVPLATLQHEINAKRPVGVGFTWSGAGSHQLIVYGWNVDNIGPVLVVHDPRNGSHTVSYDHLKNAYGMGRWEHTWTGIA